MQEVGASSSERAEKKGALVITGGGRGIGAEVAVEAAKTGTPVAILYRARADAAAEVVRRIQEGGGAALAIAADVGNEEDVVRAFADVARAFGGVRGLVNNAVDAGPPGRLTALRMADLERIFRTNVFGAFLCSREAAKRMSTRSGGAGGAIVSMSSAVATKTGAPGTWVHFAACKSAVEAMSKGLAKELAEEGIRSNVVRAGVILTETRLTQSEEYRARLIAQVPMGRMGRTSEVAAAVLWLLSEDASCVSGADLDVAGGF